MYHWPPLVDDALRNRAKWSSSCSFCLAWRNLENNFFYSLFWSWQHDSPKESEASNLRSAICKWCGICRPAFMNGGRWRWYVSVLSLPYLLYLFLWYLVSALQFTSDLIEAFLRSVHVLLFLSHLCFWSFKSFSMPLSLTLTDLSCLVL